MSKSSKNRQRREVVEQMRKQAAAAERRRTMTVLAICAVVAAVILSVAGVAIYNQHKKADELRVYNAVGLRNRTFPAENTRPG